MILFADISNYQGQIDWTLFGNLSLPVMIEATWGHRKITPYFLENWKAAGDYGLVRGAYAYLEPYAGSGYEDAQFFLDTVGPLTKPGDLYIGDFEDEPSSRATDDLGAYSLDWYQTMIQGGRKPPWFYSRKDYLDRHNLNQPIVQAMCGGWWASYQTSTFPQFPGWLTAAWQFGQGVLPGVAGKVDLNVFNGTVEQLRRYGQ